MKGPFTDAKSRKGPLTESKSRKGPLPDHTASWHKPRC